MKIAWLLIALASGILSSAFLHSIIIGAVLIVISLTIRLILAYILSRDPFAISLCNRLHYLWTFILFFALGLISMDFNSPRYPAEFINPPYFSHTKQTSAGRTSTGFRGNKPDRPIESEIYGKIIARNTTTKGERYNLRLYSIGDKRCRNLEVILFANAADAFEVGQFVSGKVTLHRIEDAKPGKAQMFAFPANETGFIPDSGATPSTAYMLRQRLAEVIETRDISGESAALIKALVCADRRSMTKERLSQFRDAGISHALAVSGMHIGIIAAMLLWVTKPLSLLSRGRKWRYGIAIAGVWIFTIVTGCSFSSIRAAAMFSSAGIAWITERRRSLFSAVCSAGLVILLYSPYALWDAGFQLSFICVLSLAVFSQRLNPIDQREHPRVYSLFSSFLVTLIATEATWMLTGYHFGAIPLNFLPANILILPILPIYMCVSLIMAGIGLLDIDVIILDRILDFMTRIIFKIAEIFNSGSLGISIPLTSVLIWTAGLILLGISLHVNTLGISCSEIRSRIPSIHTPPLSLTPNRLFLILSVAVLISAVLHLVLVNN